MKSLGIGIGTFLTGLILCTFFSNIFSSGSPENGSSYLGFIGSSILYLASIMAVCTYAIIKKISN
ncbi:hypothetical protein [Solibacillus isronensis]|uniref:hypothetical protein n=1 Tax=Solibacillus isronensis TaxID=412383 RepID=UPI0009A85E03|nr:hypothetical protein [Solibacillus isronensis]